MPGSRPTVDRNPAIEAILSMPMTDFRRQDMILLVKSYLFKEDIFIVSNKECLKHLGKDVVAYLPEELEALIGKPPDLIKQAHQIKKIFNGEILKESGLKNVKNIYEKD
jgi:hypothetical protein